MYIVNYLAYDHMYDYLLTLLTAYHTAVTDV